MVRRREHGSGKAKASVPKLLGAVVEDVIAARAMPTDEWRRLWPDPFTSMAIPAGQGREFPCTQAGIDAAYAIADQTWDDRVDLRQTVAREPFRRLAFNAIGMAIANVRSHLPPDQHEGNVGDNVFDAVADDYAKNLDLNTAQVRADLDRHVPCHIFDPMQGVPSFAVGPVHFRTRADWIAAFVTDPAVLAHIRQAEADDLNRTAAADRLLARAAGREAQVAWDVLSAIWQYSWVATVRLNRHEITRSHHKAATIVGLALDAIGLRFHLQDALRFTRAGDQHLHTEDRLATTVDGVVLRGFSSPCPGLSGPRGAMVAKMQAERPFLDAAGRLLERYVTARNDGRAPHVVERWANALYWLGEARREHSDFMAVVDYGCAADGLSRAGGESNAMVGFAEAALNPHERPTPVGTLSVRDAVLKVYQEGRNKLAHGEEPGLLEDRGETRAIGDNLVCSMMNVVTLVLDGTITDKPEILSIKEEHAYRLLGLRLKGDIPPTGVLGGGDA